MDERLEIKTLGASSIQRNGQPVKEFVSQRAQALVIYLACEQRSHTRNALASMLWSDLPQARALGNLRVILSNLQQVIAPWITLTHQEVSFNPETPYWLDVHEIERSLNYIERQRGQRGYLSRHMVADLRGIVGLCRGDFLEDHNYSHSGGESFEEWILLQRVRIQNRVIGGLEMLVADAIEHNELANGITYTRQLLQLDPLLESGHRHLMLLLAQTGQIDAAVAHFNRYHQMLHEQYGLKPDEITIELHNQIVQGVFTSPPAKMLTPINFSLSKTKLIGREHAIEQIATQLDEMRCHLLTLVGAGGIGKTSLALEVASDQTEDFPDGIYLISLAPLDSAEFIIPTIAAVLGVVASTQEHTRQQLSYVLESKRMLLILDNFEHLLAGAADIVELLEHAPHLKMLVTSRERLNVKGEYVYPVHELDYPRDLIEGDLSQFSAVQLFVENAQRVAPDFSFAESQEAVVRICQLVEGMPLGLQLAAAWLKVISIDQIVLEIEHNLDLLSTTMRNIPDRHRSLRATFNYSWDLLDDTERKLLRRLAVFRDGFDLAAAQAVAGAGLPLLAALVDKSLIRHCPEERYDFHELLRRFAYEMLLEADEAAEAENEFARYFVQLAEAAKHGLEGADEAVWLDRLDVEIGNLRAVMEWGFEHHIEVALRIAYSLLRFWQVRGYFDEGKQWIVNAMSACPEELSSLRPKGLYAIGILTLFQGNYAEATSLLEQSAAIHKVNSDVGGLARCLNYLGLAAHLQTDYAVASTCFEESLKLARAAGDHAFSAYPLHNLGLIALAKGKYDEAIRLFSSGLAICRECGSLSNIALCLNNLGAAKTDANEIGEAREYYEQSLVISQRIKSQRGMALTTKNLAFIYMLNGQYEEAQVMANEALQIYSKMGDRLGIAWSYRDRGELELRAGRFADAEADTIQSLSILKPNPSDKRLAVWCALNLGEIAVHNNQVGRAARLLTIVENLCQKFQIALPAVVKPNHEANMAWLSSHLDATTIESVREEVSAMTVEEAIDYALASIPSTDSLTLRSWHESRCKLKE